MLNAFIWKSYYIWLIVVTKRVNNDNARLVEDEYLFYTNYFILKFNPIIIVDLLFIQFSYVMTR